MLKDFNIDFIEKDKINEKNNVLDEIKLLTEDENSLIFRIRNKKVYVFENKEKDSFYHTLINLFETENEESVITLLPVDFNLYYKDMKKEELENLNPKKRFYLLSIIFKKLIDKIGRESSDEYYFLSKNTFYKLYKKIQ